MIYFLIIGPRPYTQQKSEQLFLLKLLVSDSILSYLNTRKTSVACLYSQEYLKLPCFQISFKCWNFFFVFSNDCLCRLHFLCLDYLFTVIASMLKMLQLPVCDYALGGNLATCLHLLLRLGEKSAILNLIGLNQKIF